MPAVRLGIAYPADAVQDIVNALGPQMAKVTLFTGAPMSADKMVAAGFLLEEIAADAFDGEVSALAHAIAANAPIALHASSLAVRAVIEQDSDLLREAEVIGAETFDSADCRRRPRSFHRAAQTAFHREVTQSIDWRGVRRSRGRPA